VFELWSFECEICYLETIFLPPISCHIVYNWLIIYPFSEVWTSPFSIVDFVSSVTVWAQVDSHEASPPSHERHTLPMTHAERAAADDADELRDAPPTPRPAALRRRQTAGRPPLDAPLPPRPAPLASPPERPCPVNPGAQVSAVSASRHRHRTPAAHRLGAPNRYVLHWIHACSSVCSYVY